MPLGTRGGVPPPGPPEDCAFAAFSAGTSRRRPIARACLTEIFIGRPPERDFQATRLDREVHPIVQSARVKLIFRYCWKYRKWSRAGPIELERIRKGEPSTSWVMRRRRNVLARRCSK